MSVLRMPFMKGTEGPFQYEPPIRTSSAGSSLRPYTGGSLNDDRTITTPAFSYDYTRNPTPSYNKQHKHNNTQGHGKLMLQPQQDSTNRRLQKKPRRRRRKKKKKKKHPESNPPIGPIGPLSPSAKVQKAEAFRHKGNTPCLQWDDPSQPNKVVWGPRQQWLSSSGESPGPRSSLIGMDRTINTNKSQPSVVIGGSKPKNDVDWLIYRASFIPSAQDYILKDEWKKKNGGGFSTAKPKEYLDWIKYYAEQLPAPGDYILPEKKIRGGRIAEGKPNSDVDWSIYKATYQTPPGPGDYNNDYSTSMVVQSIQAKKGAVLQGKVVQGNSRTTVPSNFTMFKNVTTGISSTTCRTDPSMGKQIVSHQTSAPSFSFGARTDAESIYSESIYLTKLHNPPPRRRKKYKKKKMYKKDTTLVSEGAEREWSTVVDIFITHPSFKPVSLSLSQSPLSKIPQTSLF